MAKAQYKTIEKLYQEICIVEAKAVFTIIDKESQDIEKAFEQENGKDIYVYLHI